MVQFRVFDEVFINEQLESTFESKPPYLVLGHSHEPRHRAWNPAKSKQADRYLNTGSAGRFGNLIWCLEIVDGVPQVVAWHRPGGPASSEVPERRTTRRVSSDVPGNWWRRAGMSRCSPRRRRSATGSNPSST